MALLVSDALESKAFTIFAFLFGVGIAIQAERPASRNASARLFLARRLGWIFVLGTAHLFLVWDGDMLALYGIYGMLLLPSIGMPWPQLFAFGAVAIVLPEFVSFGPPFPSEKVAADLIAQARASVHRPRFRFLRVRSRAVRADGIHSHRMHRLSALCGTNATQPSMTGAFFVWPVQMALVFSCISAYPADSSRQRVNPKKL